MLATSACVTTRSASEAADRRLYSDIGRCGVATGKGKIAVSADGTLLTMIRPQALGSAATQCLARVLLDRGLDFQANDPGLALRYAAAWQRESDGLGARMAQRWLAKNRPRAELPKYAPDSESLDQFVRKLERLCGAPPGSVEATVSAVRVPNLSGEAEEQVSCVYLAALASNLKASGIRLESFDRE